MIVLFALNYFNLNNNSIRHFTNQFKHGRNLLYKILALRYLKCMFFIFRMRSTPIKKAPSRVLLINQINLSPCEQGGTKNSP